jgi:CBS domain-containing protein
MEAYGVGAIVAVADPSDRLLEGIVTDRDLCSGAVTAGKNADAVQVAEVMTPPVCGPEDTLDKCLELMQENQVRRILL